jgi:2-polyprenyl-6-hydroxyphenyl methylase/3-demethylubiquinone-9 3-methyltransferase
MPESDEVLDPALAAAHRAEIGTGRRFGFGRNWRSFAEGVEPSAIAEAERSILCLLAPTDLMRDGRLEGLRFLDAGCGSGLFTLAALRLGATVTAFDFDPDSVLTTRSLVDAHGPEDAEVRLTLLHGSVLDEDFLAGLGEFDIVYSWGVLHHTGAMWDACTKVASAVRPGGGLTIALYHDAGRASTVWWYVKRLSVALPRPLFVAFAGVLLLPIEAYALLRSLGRLDPAGYVRRWTRYRSLRGMSRWHDHLDWVGGFPYEWAGPDEVIAHLEAQGFTHLLAVDAVAWGCNEFTFRRGSWPASP